MSEDDVFEEDETDWIPVDDDEDESQSSEDTNEKEEKIENDDVEEEAEEDDVEKVHNWREDIKEPNRKMRHRMIKLPFWHSDYDFNKNSNKKKK